MERAAERTWDVWRAATPSKGVNLLISFAKLEGAAFVTTLLFKRYAPPAWVAPLIGCTGCAATYAALAYDDGPSNPPFQAGIVSLVSGVQVVCLLYSIGSMVDIFAACDGVRWFVTVGKEAGLAVPSILTGLNLLVFCSVGWQGMQQDYRWDD